MSNTFECTAGIAKINTDNKLGFVVGFRLVGSTSKQDALLLEMFQRGYVGTLTFTPDVSKIPSRPSIDYRTTESTFDFDEDTDDEDEDFDEEDDDE